MPVTSPPPIEPRRAPATRTRRERRPRDFDSLLPALGITLLLHALIFETAKHSSFFDALPAKNIAPASPEPLEVTRDPKDAPIPANLLPPQMRPPVPEFVHVNPMAPSRVPESKKNTGAADQRAAQPVPDKDGRADRAKVKGEMEESGRIVNAVPREFLPEPMRPAPGTPLGAPVEPATKPAEAAAPAPAKAAEGPSDRLKAPQGKPVADKGPAFVEKPGTEKAAKAGENDKHVETPTPKKIEGVMDGADTGKGVAPAKPAPDAKNAAKPADKTAPGPVGDHGDNPKPRPHASLAGTSGPLAITRENANEAGVAAVDSRFSRMGEYTDVMLEIIQAGWWASLERSRINETGRVVIEFTLNKDGTVTRAHIVESTASQRAAYLCLGAVTDRAPFEPWPEDMVGTFGDKQEGRITFYYR